MRRAHVNVAGAEWGGARVKSIRAEDEIIQRITWSVNYVIDILLHVVLFSVNKRGVQKGLPCGNIVQCQCEKSP